METRPVTRRPDLPIGLFDSGVGGLTVLAALRARLPGERYCYLGDTARLPYGTKGADTIVRYSLQASEKLVARGIKLLVVACNTASAAALPRLARAYPHIPVVGVVAPGAAAACKASASGRILVLATESTIRGGAYEKAIMSLRPNAKVTGVACSLFVSLAEEGWMEGPVAEAIAARYLENLPRGASKPDCAVLGCTHFPPLASAFRSVLGPDVVLVDSAATTAVAVEEELQHLGILRAQESEQDAEHAAERATQQAVQQGHPDNGLSGLTLLTTDAPERFARVGSLFLGTSFSPADVELVTL